MRELHTPMDLAEFERIGLDPDTTQARDQPRMCAQPGCGKLTFNQMGGCDRHYIQRPDKVAVEETDEVLV